jgi:5-bromo-4-chloroindolyl phosphate hydrolysis protein
MSALDRYRGLAGRYVIAALAAVVALPVFVLAFQAPVWLALLTSAAIFAVLGLFAAVRTPLINAERTAKGINPPMPGKGGPAMKAAFGEALPALARIEKVIDETPKNQLRDRLERISETGRKIILEVEEDPARLGAVTRLLTYYLPRTADLSEAYAELRAREIDAPERRAAMEDVAEKLEHAFVHYAERLVDNDMRGVDMDIKLLNEALREDLGR